MICINPNEAAWRWTRSLLDLLQPLKKYFSSDFHSFTMWSGETSCILVAAGIISQFIWFLVSLSIFELFQCRHSSIYPDCIGHTHKLAAVSTASLPRVLHSSRRWHNYKYVVMKVKQILVLQHLSHLLHCYCWSHIFVCANNHLS